MRANILQHYAEEFGNGRDLTDGDAEAFFDCLIAESDESIIGRILNSWETKGTTEDELYALARVMRLRMKRVDPQNRRVIDIVGTGGSRAKTFNVSTAAAFVVAGAGFSVAKHGNRAATSTSGSSDVLGFLGINTDISPETAERCLKENGICFMFAPRFHSLSPKLAKVRRAFGRPTIFNNLGPLCNPASAKHQVVGVWDENLLEKTAHVLARLGTSRSWIVNGEDGLDEISLFGKTQILEITGDQIARFEITAEDFGIISTNENLPANCSAAQSAVQIRKILGNEAIGENPEKLVLINAAAAIYISETALTLPESYKLAENSVRSGSALRTLKILATVK